MYNIYNVANKYRILFRSESQIWDPQIKIEYCSSGYYIIVASTPISGLWMGDGEQPNKGMTTTATQ